MRQIDMAKPSTQERLAAMKAAAMFSALDDEGLAELLSECEVLHRKAGQRIFWPSDPAERFFVILAGQVKIYMLSPRGDEQILHLYRRGETFGEAAMWAEINYPAFADALTDTTLLAISRRRLRELIARDADLAMGMMAGLSRKLREFNRLIEQLSLKEAPARLAAIILAEADRAGSDTFRLRQTKRQLAGRIGTVAETLSRALGKLRGQGLIEVKGPHITVLDRRRLRDVAEKG